MKIHITKFLNYYHKRVSDDCFKVNDPTLVVLTVDSSKVPYMDKERDKTQDEKITNQHAQAVYEALPKTWTIRECYEDGSLFVLKFIFSIGEGMSDWTFHSRLYRLEHLDNVPLTLSQNDMEWFADSNNISEPCVLDKGLWNFICLTLNSDAFKKKAFPGSKGNA